MDICKDDGADWEELSMDSAQWNVLLRQLEDLSMLDFVLQQRIKVELNALPHRLKWKSMPISLRLLLEKGRGNIKNLIQNFIVFKILCSGNFLGAISEIVAYWIGTTGLHPKTLIELEKKEILGSLSEGEPEDAEEASSVDPNAYKIFGKRQIIYFNGRVAEYTFFRLYSETEKSIPGEFAVQQLAVMPILGVYSG